MGATIHLLVLLWNDIFMDTPTPLKFLKLVLSSWGALMRIVPAMVSCFVIRHLWPLAVVPPPHTTSNWCSHGSLGEGRGGSLVATACLSMCVFFL